MKSLIWTCIRRACVLATILGFPVTALALPTCPSVLEQQDYDGLLGPVDLETPGADCTINWVQNGQMLSIDWTLSEEYHIVQIDKRPDGTQVLAAPRQPHLIDIDEDGWLDVAVFSLLGMVNGDYNVFRYDPETDDFVLFGIMNGAGFAREPGGYLTSVGRSSAAASGVEIYAVETDGLAPRASLYVDAGLQTGPGGAPECRVVVGDRTIVNPNPAELAQLFPDAPDLIARYCALYSGPGGTGPNGTNLFDLRAEPVIVPDDTVFYCQLQGTAKAVTVTLDDTGYRYAFGPIDGPPELTLDRPTNQVRVLPDNGAGPSRFGEISFQNGDYEYVVSYGYEQGNFTDSGFESLREETFQRTLIVFKSGDHTNPVYNKVCDPDRAADSIFFLDRS